MVNQHKNNLLSFSSVSILIALFYFFSPESASAADIEPLYKVLQTNTNIKEVWGQARNLVNLVVIAALIYIAFLNILRINMSSYAIKKFLPTLIFAIILANFSYLICRLLVDLANVALSLLMDGVSAKNAVNSSGIGIAGAFDFSETPIDVNNLWKSLIYILGMFVGAIAIYILAFLFYIRNYVIYFLVGISPLAFMTIALTDTKKLFSQWWGQYLRWVFMPIISIFWLWLGGVWYSSGFNPNSSLSSVTSQGVIPGGDFNSNLFAFIFALLCYYLAITTPFKMGGAIMGKFADYSKRAGKLGLGATGVSAGYNYLKEKNSTTWNARKVNVQNWVKDKTGIGKGLDAAKQKLDDANTRRSLISDEGRGAYIQKAGDKRAKWQVENMSKEGTAQYYETLARGQYIRRVEALPEGSKERDWLRTKRTNSVKGAAAMASADAEMSALNEELKSNMFKELDMNGRQLSPEEKKKREEFVRQYASSMYRSENNAEMAKKASNDPIKKVYFDRASIDNAAQEHQDAKDIHKALEQLIELERKGDIHGAEAQKRRNMIAAKGYNIQEGQAEELQADIEARKIQAEKNYETKLSQITEEISTNGGKPLDYMSGLVETGADGKVTLKTMGNLEKSRVGKRVSAEVGDDAATAVQKWSMEERLHTLQHGNGIEGIEKDDLERFFGGRKSENDAKTNYTIESFIKATHISQRTNDTEAQENMRVKLDILANHSEQGMKELAEAINRAALRADPSARKIDTSKSATEIQAEISKLVNMDGISGMFKNSREGYRAAVNAFNSNKALGHGGMASQHG